MLEYIKTKKFAIKIVSHQQKKMLEKDLEYVNFIGHMASHMFSHVSKIKMKCVKGFHVKQTYNEKKRCVYKYKKSRTISR